MIDKYENIEKALDKIKCNNKSNQHQVFNLRKMISGGIEDNQPDFDNELLSLKSKGKKVYNDLLKAGTGLKTNVFNFLNHIWKTENTPSQ